MHFSTQDMAVIIFIAFTSYHCKLNYWLLDFKTIYKYMPNISSESHLIHVILYHACTVWNMNTRRENQSCNQYDQYWQAENKIMLLMMQKYIDYPRCNCTYITQDAT